MPRYAQLLVSAQFLGDWIKHGTAGFTPIRNHLPSDASLAGVYNAHPGIIGLIFESTAFPETDKGSDAAMLPLLPEVIMGTRRTLSSTAPSAN